MIVCPNIQLEFTM